MNQRELELKVQEVFSDEEYVKSLFDLETPEEVQASLEEKGISISVEEVVYIYDCLIKQEAGELTDEDLVAVNGGCAIGTVVGIVVGAVGAVLSAAGIVDNHVRW